MNVEIAIFDGFEELDAIGPYEVLAVAGARGGDVTASLRSLDGEGTVPAALGARMESDGTLGETDPDVVVVPGGGWNDRADAGAWAEVRRGDLPRRLAELHDEGVTVASVCTGAMVLAEAGLLDGRPATTHGDALADLRETDAEVVEARVVDDGDVLTAGGVTAGIDLAVHLLERELGEDVATAVAEGIEYERRGPVHRADG